MHNLCTFFQQKLMVNLNNIIVNFFGHKYFWISGFLLDLIWSNQIDFIIFLVNYHSMVLIWLSCALCCYVHQKVSWVWQGRTKAYCLDGLIRLYQTRIPVVVVHHWMKGNKMFGWVDWTLSIWDYKCLLLPLDEMNHVVKLGCQILCFYY